MPLCLENPHRDSFGKRCAKVAGFGKAVRGDRLGREDGLGGLGGGVHDHRIGDAAQPPADGDPVELALGIFAVRAQRQMIVA